MAIFHGDHNREHPYAIISKSLLDDDTLTWQARGLAAHLMGKPPGWKISIAYLVDRSPGGITQVRAILKELKESGYLVCKQKRNKIGKFESYDYDLFENKMHTTNNTYKNETPPISNTPQSENLTPDNITQGGDLPRADLPQSENLHLVNKDLIQVNNEVKVNNDIYYVEFETCNNKVNTKVKNESLKLMAERVLDFLNAKANKVFRKVDTNLNLIISRLQSGATEMQCRQIIIRQVMAWGGDQKMEKFLRPITLFNKTKFEQYLGELTLPKDILKELENA